MEHELLQDTEDEDPIRVLRYQVESDEEYLSRLARGSESNDSPQAYALRYSEELELSLSIAFLALNIADTADDLVELEVYSVMALAGASVYIASHLLHRPKSLAGDSERTIHNVYRIIYSSRYELVNEDWRRIIGGAASLGEAAEALPSLPFPPLEVSFSDTEGEGEELVDMDLDSTSFGLELVKELCFLFRDGSLEGRTWRMAEKVADRMDQMVIDWSTVNPWCIAAACTLMASHLALEGKPLEDVSAVSGVQHAAIRDTYEVMYNLRSYIVRDDWFDTNLWTRADALHFLPEPFEISQSWQLTWGDGV